MKSRKIKFRAWDRYDKKLYKVEKINFVWQAGVCVDMEGGIDALVNSEYPDHDCVLMQYTGMRDRYGQEIYEGDIVIRPFLKDKCPAPEDEHYTVVWMRGAYMIRSPHGKSHYRLYSSYRTLDTDMTIQVVGNIYEGITG